jgi:glutamine synthetase adenylyltransferase
MNRDEIDRLWHKALLQSVKDGETYTRYHFAALVEAAARADERARVAKLEAAITKLRAAKGRYHTQLAACDLFDLVGLPNERPKK